MNCLKCRTECPLMGTPRRVPGCQDFDPSDAEYDEMRTVPLTVIFDQMTLEKAYAAGVRDSD